MTHALNTHCPWSGKPVTEAGLTRYRGHTLGFCNSGCRDKFEAATTHFDAAIAAHDASTAVSPLERPEVYKPRRFRSGGTLELSAGRFKLYLIDRNGAELGEQEAVLASRAYVDAGSIPADVLGHIIVHRGEEADWLLVQWWTPGGILNGVIASCPQGANRFERTDPTVLSCVWEQVVMIHERQAWIRNIITATPDVEAYFTDTLPDGEY